MFVRLSALISWGYMLSVCAADCKLSWAWLVLTRAFVSLVNYLPSASRAPLQLPTCLPVMIDSCASRLLGSVEQPSHQFSSWLCTYATSWCAAPYSLNQLSLSGTCQLSLHACFSGCCSRCTTWDWEMTAAPLLPRPQRNVYVNQTSSYYT